MKIHAARAPLADALSWVAQAIPKRPQAPAMGGIRLVAEGSTLTMQAFDYDVSHTATLDVDVLSKGEALVSGHFVRDVVGALKSADIELVVDGDRLTITAGRSTYSTQLMKLDDYPALPSLPDAVGEVGSTDLASIVAAVKFPIDDGSPHPQVRGLHLRGEASGLTAVGSSRFMVAEASCAWRLERDFDATVHSKQFDTAVKGLQSGVTIGFKDGLLGLSDGLRAVTMRTYAEEYVAWGKLIRASGDDNFACSVSAEALREACVRTGHLANDETPIVLTFSEDDIEVNIAGQEIGFGVEFVEAEGDGHMEIAMNARFLVEALGVIPSGRVSIGLLDPKKPMILRPVDHPRICSVLMPKHIPGGDR